MKLRTASAASYGITEIETFFESTSGEMLSIGRGTGFFTKIHDRDFLVTNWHVLTNRNPNNPNRTLSKGESPTHIRLHIARREEPNHFAPLDFFPLYEPEGRPAWLEHHKGYQWADIAILPGNIPTEYYCPMVENYTSLRKAPIFPGIDVCIIGFPFSRNTTNPFPIWKKSMIASEPAYKINGKPFAYLDTAGRPGMSGSPVFAISDSVLVPRGMIEALESAERGEIPPEDALARMDPTVYANPNNQSKSLEFVGVYSGSLGDSALDKLNLGRFWPSVILEELKAKPRRGENPFPPESREEAPGDDSCMS